MRRGSSAHWMTFLSRTSHTGSYAARSIGPSDLSMLRTRSKKPVDPSQTANGGAACAYAHKKCRSGSVAKFIRARSRRQNLPPQPILAERKRYCPARDIFFPAPAAAFAPPAAFLRARLSRQHAVSILHARSKQFRRLHFVHFQTSRTSIPYIDRINFLFRRYSFVRVGPLFTSSTIFSPDTSRMYEKSAVYRIARTRSPASVTYDS